jgi:hypothetical protein
MTEWTPIAPYGPAYPKALPGVDRYRRAAARAGGVANMSAEERRAYGRAVLDAINGLHKPKAKPQPCPCASGTWHSDGRTILDAVRRATQRSA